MNLSDIKKTLHNPEYDFLKSNPLLNENICILGLGGSHAYGTNTDNSDLDIRGAATKSFKEIMHGEDFEQVCDNITDTTIYSVNKLISLLSNCNPNVIELLGLKHEHYLYISDAGQMLLDNKDIFLSQKAFYTFGGYANMQLYRLSQRSKNYLNTDDLENHILKTLNEMIRSFNGKYTDFPEDSINLYIDKAVQKDFNTEIFMDVKLSHYPLRDYKDMWSELHNTVKAYSKIGKRNQNAIDHGKLGKHMMHLVRLYYTGFDILEKGEIKTYRDKEHDLLMQIRNGCFLNPDMTVNSAFYDLQKELEDRFTKDFHNTDLPKEPDYKKIKELLYEINKSVVEKEKIMENMDEYEY